MIFHDITLTAGERASSRRHDSAALSRRAVEVFASMLADLPSVSDGCGYSWIETLSVAGTEYELRFSADRPGAAVAFFFVGEWPITASVLLAGSDPEAERLAIGSFQRMIVGIFGRTAMEPGFDLLSAPERPLVATEILPPSASADAEQVAMIADMETCLAAAYFEAAIK